MKNNNGIARGFILDVPFEEKDQAKGLGAWWDPDIKKWFVPKGRDTRPFLRWFPKENSGSGQDTGPNN